MIEYPFNKYNGERKILDFFEGKYLKLSTILNISTSKSLRSDIEEHRHYKTMSGKIIFIVIAYHLII